MTAALFDLGGIFGQCALGPVGRIIPPQPVDPRDPKFRVIPFIGDLRFVHVGGSGSFRVTPFTGELNFVHEAGGGSGLAVGSFNLAGFGLNAVT